MPVSVFYFRMKSVFQSNALRLRIYLIANMYNCRCHQLFFISTSNAVKCEFIPNFNVKCMQIYDARAILLAIDMFHEYARFTKLSKNMFFFILRKCVKQTSEVIYILVCCCCCIVNQMNINGNSFCKQFKIYLFLFANQVHTHTHTIAVDSVQNIFRFRMERIFFCFGLGTWTWKVLQLNFVYL